VDEEPWSVKAEPGRAALLHALARRGIAAHGRSGLNVWVPVPDEERVARLLAEAGWAVRPGARYRQRSAPAIRVTIPSTCGAGPAQGRSTTATAAECAW